MAHRGNFSSLASRFTSTVEQLQEILHDSDSLEILLLAAGQHSLDVKFIDLLKNPEMKTFMCSIEVGSLLVGQECIGYGQTKIDAKINAAEEALVEIKRTIDDVSSTSSSTTPEQLQTQRQSTLMTKHLTRDPPASRNPSPRLLPLGNLSNPIGALQEFAVSNGFPKPQYDEVDEYGESHKKTFVMQCVFRNMTTEGIASTKKKAKTKSAEEMLDRLHGKTSQKDTPPPPKSKVTTKISQTAKDQLKEFVKKKGLGKLEWHDLGQGFCQNSLCFLRVKTNPVTVCSGSGMTMELAQDDAARNALRILRMP